MGIYKKKSLTFFTLVLHLPLRSIHTDREVVIATVNFTEDASSVAAVAVVALPAGVDEPLETYDHFSFSSNELKTNKIVIIMHIGHIINLCAILFYLQNQEWIPTFRIKLINSPNFLKNMAKRRLKTFLSPEFLESRSKSKCIALIYSKTGDTKK